MECRAIYINISNYCVIAQASIPSLLPGQRSLSTGLWERRLINHHLPRIPGRGEKMLARSARRQFFLRVFSPNPESVNFPLPLNYKYLSPRSHRIVIFSLNPHHSCPHTLALWNTLPIVFFCVHTGMNTPVFNTIVKRVLQVCFELPRV